MAPAGLKVASPGTLTQKEAVALTRELVEGFGTHEFQAKLEDFRSRFSRAAPGKERNRLGAERSKLFLEVQAQVLPAYGFSPDAKGVFQMSQAMQPHNPDPEFGTAAGLLNVVCGLDVFGAPLEPRRPQVRSPTPPGGPVPATTGTFKDGESGVSRFTGVPKLNGSLPYSATVGIRSPKVVGDSIIVNWDLALLALTFELDIRWRWKANYPVAHTNLGSRIFACTAEGWALSCCVETGKELWRRRYSPLAGLEFACAATDRHGGVLLAPGFVETPGAAPSPNGVFALSAADGSELWSVSVAANFLSHMGPVVAGERVVTRDNMGSLACIALNSGAILWYKGGDPGMQPNSITGTRPAVSQLAGLVCACTVLPGEAVWNAPAGGKSRVSALNLETGRQRWEVAFDMEAHVTPVILADKGIVLVALGNKGGAPPVEEDGQRKTDMCEGDSFPGLLAGLSLEDGALLWTLDRPWQRPCAAGVMKNSDIRPRPWAEPVVGADGRVFTWFHDGTVMVLDGGTGRLLDTWDMSWAPLHAVALGDGVVVLCTWARTSVFLSAQLPRPHIVKPLEAPFEATGTEHFVPTKNHRNDHTLTCEAKGPIDLSEPSWSFETPSGNRAIPFSNLNWYCNPVIDSQRNIYNMTETGWLYVHRPDGSLRGSIYCGMRGTTPAMEGTELYVCNSDGIALRVDLETLEIVWASRYAQVASCDTWMPTVSPEVVIVGGHLTKPGNAHPIIDGPGEGTGPGTWEHNWWIFGLERATGKVRWKFTPHAIVYNLNPTYIQWEGHDIAIIMDINQGLYFINCRSGDCVWARGPTHNGSFHDICGVTMGPDKVIYMGSQDGSVKNNEKPDRGTFPQQPGIIEAFDVSSFPPTKKWEVKKPYSGMLQSVVAPAGEGKYVLIVPMGENGDLPCAYKEDRASPAYQGMLYGLDPENGEELWSFSPPPWMTETGSCRGSKFWCPYLPASWCSPVVDGRGTLHIYWMGGIMYTIQAATGRVLSSYDLGTSVTGSAAVAPGLLVVEASFRVLVWRDEELEDSWLREAEAAGDPRAKVGRRSTSEEARQRGIKWGLGAFARPPPEIEFDEELQAPPRAPESADATPAAKPAAAPAAPTPAAPAPAAPKGVAGAEGRRYVVVGGKQSGGISVRTGSSLKSVELPARLATGAEIKELEVVGDRVRYEKIKGEGPDSGWVSKSFKGIDLLKPRAS